MENIKKIWEVYFSGTGNTEKVVKTIGKELNKSLNIPLENVNFTDKNIRQEKLSVKNDIVILGVPTIAGRVPNLMLPYIESIDFKDSIVICIVTFGNRNFDDSLLELKDIVEERGGIVIGCGAFIGEHSFSYTLGKGRPNKYDIVQIEAFAKDILSKIAVTSIKYDEELSIKDKNLLTIKDEVLGRQKEERTYYIPKDENGNKIDIRKVKPKTTEECDLCGWCIKNCPLKSIREDNPKIVDGICMKCCRCVKGCHCNAKYFDDRGFLYHRRELEEKYEYNKDNVVFL